MYIVQGYKDGFFFGEQKEKTCATIDKAWRVAEQFKGAGLLGVRILQSVPEEKEKR